MEITSSAFNEGEMIPKKYTCDDIDISPPLKWSNIPEGTKRFAIICDDPDAPMGTFNHWVIWNIEPTGSIPEGIPKEAEILEPIKAIQGRSDFGRTGYGGPCPPRGKPHRYFFKVYGLDIFLNLPVGSSKKELEKAMEGHVLQYGEAIATYGR